MKKIYFIRLVSCCILLSFSISFYAQLGTDVYTLGFDNANNYLSSWSTTNNGTGFSNWSFDTSGNGSEGSFIGSFSSDIDVENKSFGLYANSNSAAISGVSTTLPKKLEEGDTFKISVAVNYRDGNKGFDLRNDSNTTIINFNVGSDKYILSGTELYGNSYDSNTVITFTFTQNASSLSWIADRSGGITDSQSGDISGITTGTISNIRLYNTANSSGDGGDERNFFFNSLEFKSLYTINNNATVNISSNRTIPYLDIKSGSTISINAGNSLIIMGTASGNLTYNQTLGSTNWHLMSAPVSNITFNDDFVSNNNIDSGVSVPSNRGIASYNTNSDSWSYLQSGASLIKNLGEGISIKQSIAGNVAFTGAINNSDTDITITTGGNGNFNLIGNPYVSAIKSNDFLTENTNKLTSETIWIWNQANNTYEAYVTSDNYVIAPTQWFFISSSDGTDVTIKKDYQTYGGTFQRNSETKIKLLLNNNNVKDCYLRINYSSQATKGFDNGLDGETFGGVSSNSEIYSNLIENNLGKKYQVQSLPDNDLEFMAIPIGVTANAGEISFSVETINLPTGLKVFLEDKNNNSFTRLDEVNSDYTITLNESINGTGRFFLHTRSEVLNLNTTNFKNISIFTTNNRN